MKKNFKDLEKILDNILSNDKPEEILKNVLQTCSAWFEADAATIVLWESDIGFFNTIYNISEEIPLKGMILTQDEGGLDGRIFREKEREFIQLTKYSKNMDAFPLLKPLGFSFAIGSRLYLQEDNMFGSVSFYFKERTNKFDKDELKLLKLFSKNISVAVSNGKIVQKLEYNKNKEEHSRNILDLLLNSSPDIIINTDIAGKIQYWNKATEINTGFTANEMMEKKLPLVAGENEEKFYELFGKIRGGEEIKNKKILFNTNFAKNSSKKDVSITVVLSIIPIFNQKEKIDSVLLIGKNISENEDLRKKVDEFNISISQRDLALRRKNKALNQTKKELLYAEKLATIGILTDKLNHQINNPLMSIISSLNLLIDDINEIKIPLNSKSPKSVIDDFNLIVPQLKDIIYEGERIKSTLIELRYFAEVSKEKHFRKNNLVDAFEQTLKKTKKRSDLENITLIIEKKINKSNVFGNFNQLMYILKVILDNAIISIQNRRQIENNKSFKGEIKMSIVKFELNTKNHYRLIIQDNGIGIEEYQVDKIFDPFFSDWPISSAEQKGDIVTHIGLSLATTKIIIQNHHAHITVRSSIANKSIKNKKKQINGSSFIIDFPESL